MEIQKNYPLRSINTFGIEAEAQFFKEFFSEKELVEALGAGIRPVRILGGGSNILFIRNVEGLLLKNSIVGIEIENRAGGKVEVAVGGGVVWHDFVLWAVEQGFGGVENLSLIPGTVGAAPVQNIGAYGVELKDVFKSLRAVNLATGKIKNFSKKQCEFGYRDSIFKRGAKGLFCITEVKFELTTDAHRLNTSYGDIQKTLETMSIQQPTIADVSRAVVAIRSSKLPDPKVIGNCGSFFKNPTISAEAFSKLLKINEKAPSYPQPDGRVKVPAGWLIEQCGWKGRRVGNAGCFEKQALVLVNHGGATGEEVFELASKIISAVFEKFEILLDPEVNVW